MEKRKENSTDPRVQKSYPPQTANTSVIDRARRRIKIVLDTCHYIGRWESSRKHVGVELLCSSGNIYESTHAHYDGEMCTYILFINETQVAQCGSKMSVHSCEHLWEYACALRWKDMYLHFFTKLNPSRIYKEWIFSPLTHVETSCQ